MNPAPRPGWWRALRACGLALCVLVAVFLVARAVVEVVSVNPGDPATYRDDWGGPSYAGVLLVHAGPGLAVLVLGALWLRRRRRGQPERRG